MSCWNRRRFIESVAAGLVGAVCLRPAAHGASATPKRKMTIDLRPGSIGVTGVSQAELIDLASRYGFESVEPFTGDLGKLSESELAELLSSMTDKSVVFGAAGLPVQFRKGEPEFTSGLKALPAAAEALQRAGVTRVGTYLMPTHATLTYLQNFREHTHRLREVAKILGDHGQRLGLEYVGPKTKWSERRFPFIHTMLEMKELIAAIGLPNVGFVLDSWHWYCAGETKEDLLTLDNADIVAVDLNDAPAGIPIDRQLDLSRELPMATGVIDLSTFLNTLNQLGYDGPVRAEPFNKALNELPNDAAVAETAKAMKKAFALIE